MSETAFDLTVGGSEATSQGRVLQVVSDAGPSAHYVHLSAAGSMRRGHLIAVWAIRECRRPLSQLQMSESIRTAPQEVLASGTVVDIHVEMIALDAAHSARI